MIGSDPGTGISALKTDHVVATRAADVAGCEPGTQVTALAFQPQPDGTVPVAWEPSTIDAVEISTTSNALGVGAVRATATLNVTPGSALIDSRGRIVAFADPTIGANAYLPAILVNAVAQDLIHSIVPAQVHLGITSRNASGSHGAEVVSVSPNSLGAGHLSPGEVVISVGRTTVHNVGDLLNAIYSLPAHSPITLGLLTDNKGHRVAITLPTSP